MDPISTWKYILSRRKKQLILDIEHCSPITIRNILQDVRTPGAILELIAHTFCDDGDILRELVRCPNLSETTLAFIALAGPEDMKGYISGTRVMDLVAVDDAVATTEGSLVAQDKTEQKAEKKKLNLQQQLQKMAPPQKIRLAMTGGKEARGLLIRDTNKQVSLSVLDNSRITDGEIESFAQSRNVGEDILRRIATHSEWAKRYSVAISLINNPKTPPGVALPFVNRLTDKDLAVLEKSRNVSEAVRTAARGLIMKRSKKH